jgi:hypothetical protein
MPGRSVRWGPTSLQRSGIAGVALEMRLVRDTEAPEIATIGIPAANALIVQESLATGPTRRCSTAPSIHGWRRWRGWTAPGNLGRLVAYLERARGLFGANTDPVPVIETLRAEFADFRAPQYLEFIRMAMAPR